MAKCCIHPKCWQNGEDRFYGYCLRCWAYYIPDVQKDRIRSAAKEGKEQTPPKCVRCGHERVAAFCAQCGARQSERESFLRLAGRLLKPRLVRR